jgi:hypothetical protein
MSTTVSTDPYNWDHVSEGPFSKRRKHQSVVWKKNLLILGGFDGVGAFDLNDIWSFNDHSWKLVIEHAGWSRRDGHCAVVFKDSIFIIAGMDEPINCKQVCFNKLLMYALYIYVYSIKSIYEYLYEYVQNRMYGDQMMEEMIGY